jgi:hypothetical protein
LRALRPGEQGCGKTAHVHLFYELDDETTMSDRRLSLAIEACVGAALIGSNSRQFRPTGQARTLSRAESVRRVSH